jgi:hypothetical protein
MAIIGARPLSGMRLELERPRGDTAPFRYEGAVKTRDAETPVVGSIDAQGDVTVTGPGLDEDTIEKVRLLIRAACKHARAEDRPPPLRIQRWRGPK